MRVLLFFFVALIVIVIITTVVLKFTGESQQKYNLSEAVKIQQEMSTIDGDSPAPTTDFNPDPVVNVHEIPSQTEMVLPKYAYVTLVFNDLSTVGK